MIVLKIVIRRIKLNKIKITSIMPVYNVEEYISDALDSVISQIDKNIELEIIIVDDGSTDMTKDIIRDYQKEYDFIKLFEYDQVGPGQARNVAMLDATGDYIAFIDGDDILYPKSYQKLLNSAQLNDADIVVGNVSRFDSTRKFFLSGLHKKIFSDEKIGTNIVGCPNLLFDTTSWNKLFKASFLKENKITFPEGILYEDIPFNMEAHFKSSTTNIIMDYVYKWQLRNDSNKSITQSRVDKNNMLDRFTAMKKFNEIMISQQIVDQSFIEKKELKELEIDLKLFLDQLNDADDEYFELFSKELSHYIANMQTDVFYTKLANAVRIRYLLVVENRREDLIRFNANMAEYHLLRNDIVESKVMKNISNTLYEEFLDESYFDVTSDVTPITKIKSVCWNDTTITITGLAFLRYLDTDSTVKMSAQLETLEGDKVVTVPINIFKDKSHTQIYGGGKQKYLVKRLYNYDYSGYMIDIDISNPLIQQVVKEDCLVKVTLSNKGFSGDFYLSNPTKGLKVRPKDKVIDNIVYSVEYNKQWQLKLTTTKIGAFVETVVVRNDQITIEGELISQTARTMNLINYSFDYIVEPTEESTILGNRFTLVFNLSDIAELEFKENFYLQFISDDIEHYKVEVADEFQLTFFKHGLNEVCVNKTRNKLLQIYMVDNIQAKLLDFKIVSEQKYVTKVQFDVYQELDGITSTSELSFSIIGSRNSDGLAMLLKPHNINVLESGVILSYVVSIKAADLYRFGNSSWQFVQASIIDGYTTKRRIVSEQFGAKKHWHILKNNFTLSENHRHEVQLASGLKKEYFEKGPRRKKFLMDYLYPFFRKLPQKKKMVMFEAYWGKSYSCNPKAMYEYLEENYPEYTSVWSLNNPYDDIKGKAIKVRRNSWRYYYYLARSKYFINNVNWPNQYEKREHSIEVQTLHGTFLKTMGLDVENEVKTPQQLEGFRKRHSRWDYLVSPSQFMTDIARRVFEFDKEVIEYGFPRNDVLVDEKEHERLAKQVREALSIPKDKKIILYAPTYRNKSGFNFKLDIERMKEELSDEYVLLVRLHYFVAKSLDLVNDGFVYNVCNYPDVQELLLITDILMTDYSSIMFDYANLNRPMIFFTYDLEYYRDVLRGMYLNFEMEAPGRLCKETDELIDSLKDLDTYQKQYASKLLDFREKYNEFETGEASKEIFKIIFNENKNDKGR